VHAHNRVRREPTERAPEGAREKSPEPRRAYWGELRIVQPLVQDLARAREFLPLEQGRRGVLVRLPERLVRGLARVAERLIGRDDREASLGPGDRRADDRHSLDRILAAGAREPRPR